MFCSLYSPIIPRRYFFGVCVKLWYFNFITLFFGGGGNHSKGFLLLFVCIVLLQIFHFFFLNISRYWPNGLLLFSCLYLCCYHVFLFLLFSVIKTIVLTTFFDINTSHLITQNTWFPTFPKNSFRRKVCAAHVLLLPNMSNMGGYPVT